MMEGFAIGFSFVAFFVACVALVASMWAIADVWAYKRSTHQVQFVSAEDEAKESLEDKAINKELSDAEFKKMMAAFGDEREVAK